MNLTLAAGGSTMDFRGVATPKQLCLRTTGQCSSTAQPQDPDERVKWEISKQFDRLIPTPLFAFRNDGGLLRTDERVASRHCFLIPSTKQRAGVLSIYGHRNR